MPAAPETRAKAEALLRDYAAFGVDCAVGETPHDRFAEGAGEEKLAPKPARAALRLEQTQSAPRPLPPRQGAGAAPRQSEPLMAPEAAAASAREIAASCNSLAELKTALDAFDGCALKKSAKQLVFADGNANAKIMFVGEAPGREEDIEGLPFVGRSGQLLDRMIAAIGLRREDVYIANVIPWRPPGNRTPTPAETAICRPFIARQIMLCDPDVLVCLGGPSAATLLDQREGILRLRGKWFEYDTGKRKIAAIATLHPAYLLRQPGQKRLAWRDFRAVRARAGV